VGVSGLGSALQDSVQFQAWVLVDVDVWEFALLGDREVLTSRVDGDRANSVTILAVEGHVLLGLQVVGLILVTGHENYLVRVQEVDVVTLHGWHSENTMEGKVTF